MHELSLALSIVEIAAEEAGRKNGRVAAVHVRVGRLSGVDRAALEFAFEVAREGTPLADAALVVEDVPVVVHCPSCGEDRTPESAWELRCPDCGSPTPEVLRGRELEVAALEVVPEHP
jgi:hydrogenase nickel incorporation protein HypA/HybF